MEMVLRLPKNYVEVADDEMEYLDGNGKLCNEALHEFGFGIFQSLFGVAEVVFGVVCAIPTCGASVEWIANGVIDIDEGSKKSSRGYNKLTQGICG